MGVEIHRRQYWFIFVWLTALTALEVGVVYLPIARGLMISALLLLAVAKAALVGFFYMHLGHETRLMRRTVAFCMAIPAVYAAILITEAGWRLL
jgi:caa(3)-type oxidase subunit IV